MDLQETKLGVMQKIMHVSKLSLLEKIDKLLEEELVVGYAADGKPLTREKYNQRLKNAEDQLKSGQFTSQEDLEKEAETW